MFDELLKYRDEPDPEGFADTIIARIRRERRIRSGVLWATGLTGAAFGAVGALMISSLVEQWFKAVWVHGDVGPMGVIFIAFALFIAWLLNDEVTAGGG
jgi:hypothetical protein